MDKIKLGRIVPLLKGEYSSSTSYVKMDIVTYQGSSYWCVKDCTGMTPTNTTYWQLIASKGGKGDDAVEPFKGWFASSSALTTKYPSPSVGDFAYVKGSTDVNIYSCTTAGTWTDSGTTFNPANNQEFASGQSLNTVHIVDGLDSSSSTDVLSAKQGKELNDRVTALGPEISHLEGGTFDSWEWVEGKYINSSGGVTTSSNLKYSKPVKVYKGDVVHVNGAGTGIAAIAKVITEDSSYTNLVSMTDGSNAKDYYWTATEDCYVAISGRYNRESGNVDGDITFVSQFTSKADGDTLTENVARINGELSESDTIAVTPTKISGFSIGSGQTYLSSGGGDIYYVKANAGEKFHIGFSFSSGYVYHFECATIPSLNASISSIVANSSAQTSYDITMQTNGYLCIMFTESAVPTLQSLSFNKDNTGIGKKVKTNTSNITSLTNSVNGMGEKVDSLFGKDPIYGEATNTSGSTTFKEGITLDAGKYTFHCIVEGNSGDVYVRLQKDGSNVASTTMTTSRRDYSFDFELDEKKEGLCYNIYGTTTFVSIEITPHFKGFINALVNGDVANSDITALNPSVEFDAKIAQLARRENAGSGGWKQPPFILAHFSDIHGDGDNTKRILDFCDKYKDSIDDIIHTGDIVSSFYEDDFTFWATAGAANVLNTIGNHDVWEQNGSTTGHVGKDAYDKFIAPYVANWNVIQPTNAATLGLCYYYKDYTKTQSSMTTKIRLVVLDPMAYDSAQNTWLVSVLADALTNGFSVIVASHYKGGVMDYDTDCTFCSLKDVSNPGTYTNNDAASAIDDFIDDGGDFVCWIAGHTHYDQFGVIHDHPRQVCVVIDSANDVASSYSGDSPRIEGTKSQDAFNLMSVDTYTHTFRIVRVGNNMDRYLRQKNVLAYDYKAMKVIYNA